MIKQVDALLDPPVFDKTATCGCRCSTASDSADRDDTMVAAKTAAATFELTRRAIADPNDPPG